MTDLKTEPVTRDVEVERLAAAESFVETWRELLGSSLTDDYACSLTCVEAETAARLLRAFGADTTAGALLAAHASMDEPYDAHYQQADTTDGTGD